MEFQVCLLGSKKPGPQGQACPALRESEINGSARINQPEYRSVDLKKRALNFQIFSRDLFSESDEKMGFFHYSTTPIFRKSLIAGKLNPLWG
ncbi:MAG: hypothetical protein SRB2_01422 [Desulfobacteraceae bacterium Eth-SRB2]|nr:MAG: hypothetical protein SRB2_01422 [Desulfobacteraceae bacterium Eth-SRB2]